MSLLKSLYDHSSSRTQYHLDRLRYASGLLPRVGHPVTPIRYPQGRRAAIIFSADFELAWAWRFSKRGGSDPLAYALGRAEQARRNFPELLALFDRYDVPVTWATVGHLFLERCERINGRAHPDLPRPPYFENEFWRYTRGDWFDADPCCRAADAPAWYAPDLIQAILNARVKHEIACHSFSHIDFSDGICPPQVVESKLQKCQEVAQVWGLELKSFVFPGNLPGNFVSLKRHGFTAYRWHNRYELDVPRQDDLGLWQVPGGLCWEKPEGWPVDTWIGALRRCVDRALETGTVLHFWFHPSCDPINVGTVFPAMLDYVAAHRSDLWVMTMGGLVDWLTSIGE